MDFNGGITYSHEHIGIDLSGVKEDLDCRLDCEEETLSELVELKEKGVGTIIDVTNRGMGRDPYYIKRVSEASKINIIPSTGFYKEPFFTREVYELSEKELSKIMVGEIINGIEGSGIKAGVIGEIGTSKNQITEVEKKVLRASAAAHVETGKPISTHTTLGTEGLNQIKLFKEYGVDLNRVVIGHVDLSGDLDYVLRLIDKGVYVAFDTVGKINYMPDETRLEMLQEICRRGLSSRVVLSMDITRKSHLRYRGGIGYSYLLDNFIPLLLDRVDRFYVDNMLIYNPVKVFRLEG